MEREISFYKVLDFLTHSVKTEDGEKPDLVLTNYFMCLCTLIRALTECLFR